MPVKFSKLSSSSIGGSPARWRLRTEAKYLQVNLKLYEKENRFLL
jgi:hypothetical protein